MDWVAVFLVDAGPPMEKGALFRRGAGKEKKGSSSSFVVLVVSPNAFTAKNCQENIVFPRYLSRVVVDTSLETILVWWTINYLI